MKLLIMQSSLASCHFLPLVTKYSPQHPVLKHPQYNYICTQTLISITFKLNVFSYQHPALLIFFNNMTVIYRTATIFLHPEREKKNECHRPSGWTVDKSLLY
jgi:hypothetical protein